MPYKVLPAFDLRKRTSGGAVVYHRKGGKAIVALIDFGGVKEQVVTRKEFPMARARKVLKGETIAVIGYGVQGPAQALNMKDNGFKVIIGQSKQYPADWNRAKKDGWVPGKDLFSIEEACEKG